jgi:hypothetical protein
MHDVADANERLEALEGELADVCGHLNALNARLVELTADAMESGAWSQWGIHTPSHWLAWKAGLSRSHAQTIVRLASRRAELPVTFEAFARGELSADQVAPIVAKAPAWADAQICDFAKDATVNQLRSVVASYSFEAAEPPAEDLTPDRPSPTAESFSLSQTDDGSWRLTGRLDHDHGLLLDAAVREVRDALFREHGRVASAGEVLAELANRSLAAVEGASRRDRYRVHVHLDAERELLDPYGHCLPAWIRELVTCDATASIVWTRHGRPIAVGDTSRTIAPAVRRHVVLRDRSCRVPGCQARRHLDVHHVVHREHGGTNDPSNLAALCPRHHRMHHRGEIRVSGDAEEPGRLIITDQHGNVLRPAATFHPPNGPPPPPGGNYRHPIGERLRRGDVEFAPPPTAA